MRGLRGGRHHAQYGAVSFVQPFGDAPNLDVHFHSLVLDAVYARNGEGALHFHPPPPSEVDPVLEDQPLLTASIAGRVATGRRVQRMLRVGDRIDGDAIATLEGERCANVDGVILRENVSFPAWFFSSRERATDADWAVVASTGQSCFRQYFVLSQIHRMCRGILPREH